jgi:hypothetical protein
MSIVVDLDRLGEQLREHGPGYLLSAGPDGRVKAVTVEPVLDGDVLRVPGGSRGTARNLEHNDAVTVLFPPPKKKLIPTKLNSSDANPISASIAAARPFHPAVARAWR